MVATVAGEKNQGLRPAGLRKPKGNSGLHFQCMRATMGFQSKSTDVHVSDLFNGCLCGCHEHVDCWGQEKK